MVVLNHQNSPITRAERLRLNENWVTIADEFLKVHKILNIVTGGREVDELLQRIENAIESAETSVTDINNLIADVNALIATTNQTIESANDAASNADIKASEAQQATTEAQEATNAALQAIQTIEGLMTDIQGATMAAEQATQDANDATTLAQQATTEAQAATTAATESSNRADESAQNADTAASNANQVAQNMSGYDKPIEDFTLGKTFLKHQAARFNGSTYRAKVETTGNPLPADPAVENDWWTLEAKRGTDGTGAVGSVNGVMPDDQGNVQIDVGGGTWDEITGKPTAFPPSAHQHAIDDVDGLRDTLNNAGSATLERKIQHFTATEGQTVFTVDHPYTTGSNFMELVVGGIPQFSPENFTESSSTTVTLSEGVPAGTVVTAIYYTGFGGVSAIPNASLTTKGLTMLETATDSDSETTSATPKSVKAVMTKVTETDGKVTTLENNINTVEQTLTTHMDNKVTDIDGAHGLKYEEGVWTPILKDSNGNPLSHVSQFGKYEKINKKVTVSFALEINGLNAANGQVLLYGLPFVESMGYVYGENLHFKTYTSSVQLLEGIVAASHLTLRIKKTGEVIAPTLTTNIPTDLHLSGTVTYYTK